MDAKYIKRFENYGNSLKSLEEARQRDLKYSCGQIIGDYTDRMMEFREYVEKLNLTAE